MKFPHIFAIAASVLLASCGGGSSSSPAPTVTPSSEPSTSPSPAADSNEHLSAGAATILKLDADSFSEHSANLLDADKIKRFNLGNDFFENPWVAGSASTSSRDGLGGLFNNNACQDCHIRDGRGHAPNVSASEDGSDFSSILLRASKSALSVEQKTAMANSTLANVADSSVGGQIQHDAVAGVKKEASLRVSYSEVAVQFDDGHTVNLRKPEFHLRSEYAAEGYDFDPDTVFSARVAPPMIGLGLLAMIAEIDIVSQADPNDTDGNGISGVANFVSSIVDKQVTLGRFGWKAGQPSLLEQSAGAFVNDMGLTSRLHTVESCMPHQQDCLATPNGNGDSIADYNYEVPDKVLEAVAFYSAHLGVPQRRNVQSQQVQAGKALFNSLGCVDCHRAEYTTQSDSAFPELSNQRIYPYTDMLLHDMGEELSDFTVDNHPAAADIAMEYLATTREWRTPPLWGIGLTKAVDPAATFLHDGRARTIMEAVLWHGGEAEAAKQGVLALNAAQREQLLAFLNDL